jgi:tetratricopeptide (TPR) repeat protein
MDGRSTERNDNPLGFALDFLGGKAHVTLGRRHLGGLVRLDHLAMEVPGVSFPFDVSGGAGRFRHRRCRLRRYEASVEAEAFSSWFTGRDPLASYGFHEVSLRWLDGSIRIEGLARLGDRQVPFTARMSVVASDDLRIRLVLDHWRPYGYLPLPPPLLGVGLMAAAGVRAAPEEPPRPLYTLEGATAVEVDFLGLVLRRLLPTNGWRLPAIRGVVLERLLVSPEGLQVVYATPEDISTDVPGSVRLADVHALAAQTAEEEKSGEEKSGEEKSGEEKSGEEKSGGVPADGAALRGVLLATPSGGLPKLPDAVEVIDRYGTGERLLATGDVAGALAQYDSLHRTDPEDPFVLQRLLELLSCSPHTIQQARRLARRTLADEPEHESALFVLAGTAEELGEVEDAASRYAALATVAQRRGDVREAVLATLACGRLLSATDPAQSTSWYERALALDPELPQAVQALIGHYRAAGRLPELLRLQRRYLARATGRRERLRGHLTLGEIYLNLIDDPLRARAEYERAVRLDDSSLPAWNGLAEAHRVSEAFDKERKALERVVSLCETTGNLDAMSLARRRMAQAWADAGDIGRALEVTAGLLETAPEDPDVLEQHGRLSGRAGQWELAAETLERLLNLDSLAAGRRSQVSLELARVRLEGLADFAGARIFVDASLAAEETDEGLVLALRLAEDEERFGEMAELLARRAARTADPVEQAEMLLHRARLLVDPLDEGAAAIECLKPVVESELPVAREALQLMARIQQQAGNSGPLLLTLQDLSGHVFAGGDVEEPDVVWMLTLGEILSGTDGQRDEAKRQLRRLHAAVPNDPRPLMALTDLLSNADEQAERESLLERLATVTEGKGDALRQGAALKELGSLRRDQERLEDAHVVLQAAVRLAPEDPEALVLLGDVAFSLEHWEEAESMFGQLKDAGHFAYGHPGEVALRLGQLACRRGETDASIVLLQQALEARPSGVTAAECYEELQDLLARAGRWAEAAATMEAAAEDETAELADSSRVDRLFAAAEIRRRRLGDSDGAQRLYSRIGRLRPDHLGALNGLTVIAASGDDWEEVSRLLERKIELLNATDDAVTLLDELAMLYAERLDRPQAARVTYDRVLELDADHRAGLLFVGQDAHTCGDHRTARQSFERLLELGPDPGLSPEAERSSRLDIHRVLAQIALAESEIEAVESHLAAVLELEPADGESLELLDELYSGERQWDKLAEVVRHRAERESDVAAAVKQLLRLSVILGERLELPRESAAVCREILRRSPDDVSTLNRLAGLLRQLREDPVERRRTLERLLALWQTNQAANLPTRGDLLFELGALLREELGERSAGAQLLEQAYAEGCQEVSLLRSLVGLARESDRPAPLEIALGRLAEHTEDDVERVAAICERAALRLDGLEDPAAALQALEGLTAAERSDEVIELAARIHEARGDWNEAYGARADLARRAEERGDDAIFLSALEAMLSLAAERLEDLERLARTADRILSVRPTHAAALERLGEVARQQRQVYELLSVIDRRVAAALERGDAGVSDLQADAGRLYLLVPNHAEDASVRCEAALEHDPTHELARFRLAQAAAIRQDHQRCVQELEELGRRVKSEGHLESERRTFVAGLYREVAQLWLGPLQDPAQARKAWRAAAAFMEGDGLILVLHDWAEQSLAEQEWGEAAEVMEWLRDLRVEPRDALSLADAYEHLGRLDDALRVLREAPSAPDEPGRPAGELTGILRSRERKILGDAGRYGDLARALEEDARRAEEPARRHGLLLEAAEHYLNRAGEPQKAETCLLLVLEEHPTSAEAIGRLMEGGGDEPRNQRMEGALRRAGEELAARLVDGGDVPLGDAALLSDIATFWIDHNPDSAPDLAFDWLEAVVSHAPERLDDLLRLADHKEHAGQYEPLSNLLERVCVSEVLPVAEERRLGLWRARLLSEQLGQPDAALAVLDRLLDRGEDPPAEAGSEGTTDDLAGESLELRAHLLEELDRLEEAEDTLGRLAKLAEHPEAILRRAAGLAARRGDDPARISHLWRLVEVGGEEPTDGEEATDLLRDLAEACEQAGDTTGQLRALERLVDLASEPASRGAWLAALGDALAAQESWLEAQDRLRQAAELSPGEAEIHLRLAEVASQTRDLQTARLALATAHDLLPEDHREERSVISMRRSEMERDLVGDQALARRYARQAAEETRLAHRRTLALRAVVDLAREQDDAVHEEEGLRDLFELGVAESQEMDRLASLCEARAAWTGALEIYEHLRQARPEDPGVLRRLATACRATGQPYQAVEALEGAARLADGLSDHRSAADDLFTAAGLLADDADGAVRSLKLLLRALSYNPAHEDAFDQARARCLLAEDHERLISAWSLRLPALSPEERQAAYTEMARVATEGLDDLDRAASFWALGLAAGSDDAELLSSLVVYHGVRQEWLVAWDYGLRLRDLGGPPSEQAVRVHLILADVAQGLEDRPAVRSQLRYALVVDPTAEEISSRLEQLLVEDEAYEDLLELVVDLAGQKTGVQRAAQLVRASQLCTRRLDRPSDAIRFYEEGLEADPENEQSGRELLVLLREGEHWAKLFDRLESSLERIHGPERAAVADELAELAINHLGDPAAAQQYRRQALLSAPSDVRRLRALVDLLANQRQWSELVELLDEAVDTMVLDAESASGFFALLGRTYLEKLDRPDQGLAVFERARSRGALTARGGELLVEIYESNGRFRDLAALLEELAERTEELPVRQRLLVKRARVLADHLGQPAEAASMLLELFRIEPRRRRKLGRMARELLVRAQLPRDAMAVLDEELQVARDAEKAALYLERGDLLVSVLDCADEGLQEYLRVLELAPGHVEAHLGAARVWFDQGDAGPALEHAEAAIRGAEGSTQAEAHSLAGEICQELDDNEGAIDHLVAASRLDPTNLEVLQDLGRLYTALGNWEKLADAMGKEIGLTVEPKARGRLWYRRALLYRDILNLGGDALRCFREAVAVDAHNVEALAALRDFALERGDWETSLTLMERELETETEPPARAKLQLKRADLLENRLGRLEDAVDAVQEAHDLAGDEDLEIRRTLARLLANHQQWGRAADLERTLAEGEPDATARAQALMKVAGLYRRAEQPADAFALHAEVVRTSQVAFVQEAADYLVRAATEPLRAEVMELFESRLEKLESGALRLALLRHLVGLATEQGETERAERHAEALYAEDPHDRSAFKHRRRVLEREGDSQGLAELLEQRVVTASAEEKQDLLMALGALWRDKIGNLAAAARVFDEVLALLPDDLAALDARADLAFTRAEFAEAAELYERLGARPGSLEAADLAYRRGVIAEALGDEDGALSHYAEAIRLRGGHLGSLEAQARLLLLNGQDAEAATTLAALFDVVPPTDQDRLLGTGIQLARVLLRQGEPDSAAAGLERLHDSYPDHRNILALLVEIYRSAQRWSELADTYQRLAGITDEPQRRARLLYEEGRLRAEQLLDDRGATRCFLTAADLDSDDPEILAQVAAHYARTGRWSELQEAHLHQRQLFEERGDTPPAALASAILGISVAALLGGGDSAREAPTIIREMQVSDLNPEQATALLADIVQGLHASSADAMALRRVFDLLDSALGRGALPTWTRTGERLLSKDPSQVPLRRFMVRLCARLGDSIQSVNHKAVLGFLEGAPPETPLPSIEEFKIRGALAKSLAVFGPAVPDAANVPLRSIFSGLHPQLGRLAPPIDPSELGPEIDDEHGPSIAANLEALKEILNPGPVGAVFARRPKAPVSVIFSFPPVLLVDPRVADWPVVQARFVLARALEIVRAGSLLLMSYPSEQVRLILDTVAQMFDIPLPASATPDPSILRRLQDRGFTTEHFDNAAMEGLQVAFFNHLRDPVGLAEYRSAALEAANRIALLATGDLDHALHALAVQLFVESGGELALDSSGHSAPLDRPIRDSLVASQPQLAALMSFGTSPLYPTLLRRRVTLPHR